MKQLPLDYNTHNILGIKNPTPQEEQKMSNEINNTFTSIIQYIPDPTLNKNAIKHNTIYIIAGLLINAHRAKNNTIFMNVIHSIDQLINQTPKIKNIGFGYNLVPNTTGSLQYFHVMNNVERIFIALDHIEHLGYKSIADKFEDLLKIKDNYTTAKLSRYKTDILDAYNLKRRLLNPNHQNPITKDEIIAHVTKYKAWYDDFALGERSQEKIASFSYTDNELKLLTTQGYLSRTGICNHMSKTTLKKLAQDWETFYAKNTKYKSFNMAQYILDGNRHMNGQISIVIS